MSGFTLTSTPVSNFKVVILVTAHVIELLNILKIAPGDNQVNMFIVYNHRPFLPHMHRLVYSQMDFFKHKLDHIIHF